MKLCVSACAFVAGHMDAYVMGRICVNGTPGSFFLQMAWIIQILWRYFDGWYGEDDLYVSREETSVF